MATLPNRDLDRLRQHLAETTEVNYVKAQANAALQAIEDWFDKAAVRSSLSTDMNAATAPFTFSGAQKMQLIKYWLQNRFDRE